MNPPGDNEYRVRMELDVKADDKDMALRKAKDQVARSRAKDVGLMSRVTEGEFKAQGALPERPDQFYSLSKGIASGEVEGLNFEVELDAATYDTWVVFYPEDGDRIAFKYQISDLMKTAYHQIDEEELQ